MSDKPLEDAYVPPAKEDGDSEPKKASAKAEKIPVVLMMLDDGTGNSVAITESSPIRCFRFPVGHYPNVRKFKVSPSDKEVTEVELGTLRTHIMLYVLPDMDTMVENVLKSFLRASAYSLDDLRRVKGKALRTAFPYKLGLEELSDG